jgi:thiol:disulfide interchange protein DsbD
MKPFLPLLFSLVTAIAAAEEKPTKGIDIDLVSENAAVEKGKPFTVAVKVHHHPGFHTYWQNPGVAGVPVKLDWKLPEGFTAGAIQWPYPERTKMAIHPVHGFERDVLLLVEITPPAEVTAKRLELKATASWMACADGCYPGKKELALELPVAAEAKPDPGMAAAFATARAELPQPLAGWKAELVSETDAPEIRLRLTPAGDAALEPKDLYFFSSDGQISSDPPQKVETKEGGAIEIVAVRSEYGPKGKTSLPGVLVSGAPFGKGGPLFARIDAARP